MQQDALVYFIYKMCIKISVLLYRTHSLKDPTFMSSYTQCVQNVIKTHEKI